MARVKVAAAEYDREGVAVAMPKQFDIVLMDLHMPVMDGYQALEEQKKHSFEPPVVALTAHAMTEEQDALPRRRICHAPHQTD